MRTKDSSFTVTSTQIEYRTLRDDTVQKILDKFGIRHPELIKANEDNVLYNKSISSDYKVTSGTGWEFSSSVQSANSTTTLEVHYFSNVSAYVSRTYKGTIIPIDESSYNILKALVNGNIVYDNTRNEFWEIRSNTETITPFYNNISTVVNVDFIDNKLVIKFAKLSNTSIPYTVADYLKEKKLGDTLRQDLLIYIPKKASGGKTDTKVTDDTTSTVTGTSYPLLEIKTENIPIENTSRGEEYNKFGCYFNIWERDVLVDSKVIPVFPNEVTDSNRSNFAVTNILGRSVSYYTYNQSDRSVSFSLELHEELCDNYDYVPSMIRALESACYPGYESGQVNPCEVEVFLGRHFHIRGVLNSGVNTQWSKPLIDGKLVHATIQFNITETTGPYSRHDIATMGAYRV